MADEDRSVLNLTLERQYFSEIIAGTKTFEYRERKAYWDTRLDGRSYDIVRFKNGYGSDVPEMEVEILGIQKERDQYVIKLGKISNLKNWPPQK